MSFVERIETKANIARRGHGNFPSGKLSVTESYWTDYKNNEPIPKGVGDFILFWTVGLERRKTKNWKNEIFV